MSKVFIRVGKLKVKEGKERTEGGFLSSGQRSEATPAEASAPEHDAI